MEKDMRSELGELLGESKADDVKAFGEGFEDLPEGEYYAAIVECGFGESKAGNLKFTFEFDIVEDEQGEDGPTVGRKHWWHVALTSPERMKGLTTTLAKFGVDCSSISSIEAGLDELIDLEVDMKITHSVAKSGKYKGETFVNTSIKPIEDE